VHFPYCFFVSGGFLLAVTGILDWPLSMMVISISLLTLGNGFLIPLGAAGVVSSYSRAVGYASGLLGFLQLGAAAITTAYIEILSNNEIYRLGLFILFATLIGLFLHLILRKSRIDYEKQSH
jgi:DHA1 family bicyclomycin/chloramphenicol resistance-like MFS transporter